MGARCFQALSMRAMLFFGKVQSTHPNADIHAPQQRIEPKHRAQGRRYESVKRVPCRRAASAPSYSAMQHYFFRDRFESHVFFQKLYGLRAGQRQMRVK